MIYMSLCKSNSIGDRYDEPSVYETFRVDTMQEALLVMATPMVNGFFYRIDARDGCEKE